MNQFFTVFKFEFGKHIKSKGFIILTVIAVLLIGGFLSYPTISDMFASDDAAQTDAEDAGTVGIINQSPYDTQTIVSQLETALAEYQYETLTVSADEAESMVKNEELQYVVVLEDENSHTLIATSIGLNDRTSYIVDSIMQKQYQTYLLEQQGLDAQTSSQIISATTNQTVVETGKNQFESFFYTYIIVFLLYMSIMIYGQLIATSVASEKGSRAMETLITTVPPTKMMFGKVIGVGSAALLQIVIMLGSSMLFYRLNAAAWQDNAIVQSIFDIPLNMIVISIVIFILGFFLYAFIYAVIGSFAKRVEDVNASVMPVTLIFIAAFLLVMFSMSSGNVDSTLMKVCTYIPFTSPIALPARYAMSSMYSVELIISLAVLVISTIVIGYLASGIYRLGVLLYGKTPSVKEIFKQLKSN